MAVENFNFESNPIDIRKQALALWESNRLQCGWFMRDNFIPETRDDFCRCLDLLAKQGDRATYVLARKLIKCL